MKIVIVRINPDPKSGSNIINKNTINSTRVKYIKFLIFLNEPGLFAQYFDVNIINDIFIISDGWKEKSPIPIQLRAPFLAIPMPGINTIPSNIKEIMNKRLEYFFNFK